RTRHTLSSLITTNKITIMKNQNELNDIKSQNGGINEYIINISDERLAAISTQIQSYDWSQLPDLGGWNAGVGISDLKRLVNYWQNEYNWRDVERRLNELPNFITEIEGEHIHF